MTQTDRIQRYIPAPTKIIGIGANFPDSETPVPPEYPSIFLMPPSALLQSDHDILLPPIFKSVLIEGELGVVIKKQVKKISASQAEDCILGYTILNDLSGRDSTLQQVPNPLKKGCDGFLPVASMILLDPKIKPFHVQTLINNKIFQDFTTSDYLFSIAESISLISQYMTLEAGDLISMGTSAPKPKAASGDIVEIRIDGIGSLKNKII